MEMHDQGEFCPPELVRDLVFDLVRRSNLNCILDGYPRDVNQFLMMEELGADYTVVHLVVPEEELVRRASGRRICSECGEVFQLTNPNMLPGENGECTICGGAVVSRGDDNDETVLKRIAKYRAETEVVMDAIGRTSSKMISFVSPCNDDIDSEADRLVEILMSDV